jgi:hypothetical protein
MGRVMNYSITKFEKWILRRICRRLVIQSHEHKNNIKTYYKLMYEEANHQFTEDNKPTLDGFLSDCHKDTYK